MPAASAIRGGQPDGAWDVESKRAQVADLDTNGTGVVSFRTDTEQPGLGRAIPSILLHGLHKIR